MDLKRIILTVYIAGIAFLGCGKKEQKVRFDAILPLSGSAATYGEAIKKGILVAIDDNKETISSMGYTLVVDIFDSESDPAKATKIARERYEAGALALIGGVTSDEALNMVKVADEFDRILLSPSASAPILSGISRNFFRIWPPDTREALKMAFFISKELVRKKGNETQRIVNTVVVLGTDTAYGKGITEVFKKEVERYGGKILDFILFPPGPGDISGIIDRTIDLNPDAVYIAALEEDIANIIRLLREKGYDGKIMTTSAFATPSAIEKTAKYAEKVIFTQTVFDVTSNQEPIKSFVQKFQDKYGEKPDIYAAHGYDAFAVLVEALKKAGSTLPIDFVKGMVAITDFAGVTGTIQFDEKGDVNKFPRVYIIKEGVPIDYERYLEELRKKLETLRRRLGQ